MTFELIMVLKSKDDFEKKVNEKLNQGYQLHGSSGVVYHPYGRTFYYYQAVIKEKTNNTLDNNINNKK